MKDIVEMQCPLVSTCVEEWRSYIHKETDALLKELTESRSAASIKKHKTKETITQSIPKPQPKAKTEKEHVSFDLSEKTEVSAPQKPAQALPQPPTQNAPQGQPKLPRARLPRTKPSTAQVPPQPKDQETTPLQPTTTPATPNPHTSSKKPKGKKKEKVPPTTASTTAPTITPTTASTTAPSTKEPMKKRKAAMPAAEQLKLEDEENKASGLPRPVEDEETKASAPPKPVEDEETKASAPPKPVEEKKDQVSKKFEDEPNAKNSPAPTSAQLEKTAPVQPSVITPSVLVEVVPISAPPQKTTPTAAPIPIPVKKTKEAHPFNLFEKELSRRDKPAQKDGEESLLFAQKTQDSSANEPTTELDTSHSQTLPLPRAPKTSKANLKTNPKPQERTEDGISKTGYLSLCQSVEESKIEEPAKPKQSFERMLPVQEDLDKVMTKIAPYLSNEPAKPDTTAKPEQKPDTTAKPEHKPDTKPDTTAKPEHKPDTKPLRKQEPKIDRPNQSFAGLSKEELKEKSVGLNKLLQAMKNKSGANAGPLFSKSEIKDAPSTTQKPAATAPPSFSPVIDSSDDDIRDPRFTKKQWVDSPSLPRKLLLQDENQATEIFGLSVNTKVNLKEMFSGLSNIPPDSPNRFPSDK
ncbi:hypothetical protein NEDG_01263 [Nematocida displodere]|uniref:Inner centromere protein ARK-binding domain-containing protein n=1 Tax=Nematocida displodere TaxID=1805483 RepID=A0A177ECS2_9MICR|nr:hypothetical protein NEDG_01263 [Nematocida displodere]